MRLTTLSYFTLHWALVGQIYLEFFACLEGDPTTSDGMSAGATITGLLLSAAAILFA